MTPSCEDLAALATPVRGSDWRTRPFDECGSAIRNRQRWTENGIANPATAAGIRAYPLSRRVVDLLSPADPAGCDAPAHDAARAIASFPEGAGRTRADALERLQAAPDKADRAIPPAGRSAA